MTKKITFLGIETSCDETAASVIRENDKGTADVLSNIVSSQISEHKKFGGVVPELAARAHIENIEYIIKAALEESKVSLNEIDGIAATAGPGLIVCLTVGLNIGKSIAAEKEAALEAAERTRQEEVQAKIKAQTYKIDPIYHPGGGDDDKAPPASRPPGPGGFGGFTGSKTSSGAGTGAFAGTKQGGPGSFKRGGLASRK